MKILNTLKTLARNVRFLATLDMQTQHKLLKQIERTQLRQEDDLESFAHSLDDMPEKIEESVNLAMANYEIADDIRDAVDQYDFSPYLEELAEHIDLDGHIENWIDCNVDYDEIVADHIDLCSIQEYVDERIDSNDFSGTFEDLTEKIQNLELQQTSLVQGLSKRFGKLAQSLLFSADWSQEAEKEVIAFEEAEDNAGEGSTTLDMIQDPLLSIVEACEATEENK